MGSYFGIDVSQNNDMNYLVDTYRKTRQPDLDAITKKKQELVKTRTFWNQIQSSVSSLISGADKFTLDDAEEKFITRKTESSNSDYVDASSQGSAPLGNTSVKVEKLATSDLLLSDRVGIENKFNMTGTKVLSLSVGEKDFDISVEFTGEETNTEAMKKIAKAINNTDGITVNASFIKDTPDTGVLSLMAMKTGEANSIKINDTDLAKELGWKNLDNNGNDKRKIASGGKAGYSKSTLDDLNAKFTVNGIEIVRSENSVSDVIDGMTFKLKKAQAADEPPVVLNTDIDADEVQELIQPVLDKYNSAIQLLSQNKDMRRQDSALSSLYNDLRFLPSERITSVDNEQFTYLMGIGIEVSSSSTLSISNKDKLYEALKDYPQEVAQLFVSDDSFVAKLEKLLDNYHGEDNLISGRTKSLNDSIDRQDDKYKTMQARIDKEADNMKKEYTRYLESYYNAQSQLNYLQTMPTGGSSANNSLLQQAYSS
jgi:flagellar hook-associated protein 2